MRSILRSSGHVLSLVFVLASIGIGTACSEDGSRTDVTDAGRYPDTGENTAEVDPGILNVRAFGAKGDGQTDDTDAIQLAIDTAASGPGYDIKQVFFPPGGYAIRSLNLTARNNIRLVGAGAPFAVRLYARHQTTSAPAIDITGSSLHIENLTVLGQNVDGTPPSTLPSVGVLIASSGRGNDSTAVSLRNVSVLGYFDKSALYVFGSNDNSYFHTSCQSWRDGVPALVITASNSVGVTSLHVDGIHTGSPYTSDQTFVQSEFHTFKYVDGQFIRNEPSASNAIVMDGVNGVRFIGGVISGSGPSLVQFSGAIRSVVFDGNFFESENGYAPQDTFFFSPANVYGLELRNILVQNGVQANGAILAGRGGTSLYGLNIQGYLRGAGSVADTTALVRIEDAPTPDYTVISNATIAASWLDLVPGGSIRSSTILGAGDIVLREGAVDSSLKSP